MADRRKLQSEVERCLKRVSEGVDAFEDTWKKVHCATNSNQKDKYEADLKKEIKKLQRLRDQIKTWLTSGDIKDKRSLQDARKTIEIQMERFKVVERETKTKAYSKEGLGAAQKLDPAQKERDEITSWLTACIETLTIQLDKFESEMDAINLSLKKKKNDQEKLDRHMELDVSCEKHKYHISQLETLLRKLDNGTVEVDQIKKIKDDVEYYRDCSQEPDFHENDYMYDDLNLGGYEDYLTSLAFEFISGQPTPQPQQTVTPEEESSAVSNSPTSTNSRSHSPPCLENHSSEETKIPESNSSNTIQQPPSPSNANNLSSECSSPVSSHVNFHNSQPVINSQTSSTPYATATANLPNNHYKMSTNHENAWSSSNSLDEELSNDVNTKSFHCTNSSDTLHNNNIHVSKSSVPVSNSWTDSNYNRFHFQDTESSSGMHCDSTNQNIFNNSDSQLLAGTETSKNVVSSVNCQNNNARSYGSSALLNISSTNSVILDEAQSSLKNLAERAVLSNGVSNHVHNLPFSTIQNKGSQLTHIIFGNDENDIFMDSSLNILLKPSPSSASAEIDIRQIFGQYPQNNFTEDQKHALSILEVASKHLPKPMDSLKLKSNGPGAPAPTPDYYPLAAPNCNTIEFFQRLSTETLFFIFYFLQGTKAQYYAAKALKTKSWRFHTMFMMWFQRHEEPKTITDDFEQGTYVYFDFEKWVQRKKEGFTFEYKYLEDIDLN
ncbi:CCR4-NOT transcription complex subunit 3 [Trichonephila inaurata madagascariensis]|uniref:CCR4-NOT transcription complex subunit 3 n=1 Tax=Trichonephila inaurata madagascariensis TaxID=2747483 RepID=A0A8X6XG36_9ARAC|nr:CCR4-NOT transcription complex subunit 3 [Trichonephila inaurata madagascariensis]